MYPASSQQATNPPSAVLDPLAAGRARSPKVALNDSRGVGIGEKVLVSWLKRANNRWGIVGDWDWGWKGEEEVEVEGEGSNTVLGCLGQLEGFERGLAFCWW